MAEVVRRFLELQEKYLENNTFPNSVGPDARFDKQTRLQVCRSKCDSIGVIVKNFHVGHESVKRHVTTGKDEDTSGNG
jgi:hypothetical protein